MPHAGQSAANVERIKRAYAFLTERERNAAFFTKEELVAATGWRGGTVTTYLTKKWAKLVKREGRVLRAVGVSGYTMDEFLCLMSQRDEISADPRKPHLKPEVESLLLKARQSALLALQIYNNPTTVFRTEGFSVMMVIAWTALFHAIFEKRGHPYCYIDQATGKSVVVDGDLKAWELGECLKRFYEGTASPVASNLDFFILLRNKIEHRFVPEIDPTVAGECQALVLNFDDLLVAEFGTYFAIRESLAMPLQTAHVRNDATAAVLKKLQARHFNDVNAFVTGFRTKLPPEISGDQRFRFNVLLVPKPANHQGADLAIEFVKVTSENEAQVQALTRSIVAIRDRPVANAGYLRASDVTSRVAVRLGKAFNMAHHTRAWKRYRARPPVKQDGKVPTEGHNPTYCIPDALHDDYAYTPAWVEFLLKKLADPKEYEALTRRKTAAPTAHAK